MLSNTKSALAGFMLAASALALIACTIAPDAAQPDQNQHVDTQHDQPVAIEPVDTPLAMTEDSPGWDCTVQGNRQCGAPILGPDGGQVWYVITFDASGSPIAVTLRDNQ